MQGAASAIRLATHPALKDVTGRSFNRDADVPTPPVTYDHDLQQRLRDTSDRFIG